MINMQHKLSDYINTELDYWDFSGAIRITQKGKTLLEIYRGFSNREFGIKNDKNTRFSVASVTKQFTGFAIMLLYDRGLLQLNEKANGYLPLHMQLPTDITIHHLLSHTSGLHNNYNFEDDFYVGEDRKPYNQEVFFHDWIIREPIGRPGEAFAYNNSNYTLLAWIIENVSGQSYNEFLTANIFSRLDMHNTLYDNGLDIIPNRADNYLHDYDVLVRTPYTNNLFGIGAGGLVTNCDDLQKWYKCLRDKKLLSPQAYKIYLTENKNHYCYGLERYEENGRVKYAHGGDILGVSAYTQYFFDEDTCILILSNTESLDQYRLGNALAAILHGEQPQHSCRLNEIHLMPEELENYTGTYLPDKIQIEQKNGKLYLVRVNQNIHIELYCVGRHQFKRRFEEQQYIHTLFSEDAAEPSVWGYERVSTELCQVPKKLFQTTSEVYFMSDYEIRTVTIEDAPRLLAIYTYYVENTAITFEYEPPTLEEFKNRISNTLQKYPYLCILQENTILGYAYAGPFRTRAAYQWTAEMTIYLAPDAQKRGLGRRLYEALERQLSKMGIINLYACIGYPRAEDEYLSPNSAQFHEHMGYTKVGEFHNCGYKYGRWYDMIYMEKIIGEHTYSPSTPETAT